MISYKTVLELLSDPNRWCKGYLAKDAKGTPVGPSDPSACRWCVHGAIRLIYPKEQRTAIREKLEKEIDDFSISVWQDRQERTHEEVVELLKRVNV